MCHAQVRATQATTHSFRRSDGCPAGRCADHRSHVPALPTTAGTLELPRVRATSHRCRTVADACPRLRTPGGGVGAEALDGRTRRNSPNRTRTRLSGVARTPRPVRRRPSAARPASSVAGQPAGRWGPPRNTPCRGCAAGPAQMHRRPANKRLTNEPGDAGSNVHCTTRDKRQSTYRRQVVHHDHVIPCPCGELHRGPRCFSSATTALVCQINHGGSVAVPRPGKLRPGGTWAWGWGSGRGSLLTATKGGELLPLLLLLSGTTIGLLPTHTNITHPCRIIRH